MSFPGPTVARSWMRALAEHYDTIRRADPAQELCVVFDIDGTILDLRHLIAHVALAYDRERGTDLFHGLVPEDVTVSENDVDALLTSLAVPEAHRGDVAEFYARHLWDDDGVIAACAPYRGVLSVIRWFQIQPGTHVALDTGRPESMRGITLDSLNTVAASSRVRFDPDLLFMRDEGASVVDGKTAALARIEARGFRIVAVVDNEPENLEAMAATPGSNDILFLHADTIFESQRRDRRSIPSGTSYELAELISEEHLRDHVEFVWHGANDEENLRRFLESGIRWAEVDLRHDPLGRLVLRHDGFDERPWDRRERTLYAGQSLEALAAAGRSIKLDVKDGGALSAASDLIDGLRLDDDRLWFNAEIQAVGPSGFATFRSRHPNATMSCPTDFLVPTVAAPGRAACSQVRTRNRTASGQLIPNV